MKKCILCVSLFIRGILLYSQTPQAPVIQSPNVASLGIFGNIPVNYYTGVPNISIPIYNLQSGNITVPLSLQYHPGNVKPNEHPGWVGLGWNLHSYGTITRVMHWMNDENDYATNSYPSYFVTGKSLLDVQNWDTSTKLYDYFKSRVNIPYPDVEADEFYFSFMGFSGKFIFTYNGWIVDSEQNIKVEFDQVNDGFISNSNVTSSINQQNNNLWIQYNNMQSRMFKRFTLTTENGTKYIFGGEDAVEYFSLYDNNECNILFANTWYLKEIIDTDNNKVKFYYHRGFPICKLSFSGIYYDTTCTRHNDWVGGGYSYYIGNADTTMHRGYIMFPVYLSSISGKNDSISFLTSISTEKMYSVNYLDYQCASGCPLISLDNISMPDKYTRGRGFKWEQLDAIRVCNKSGNILLNYTLNFSNSTSERLTLKKIFDSSGKTYTFNYNDIPSLPDYGGDKTDHWGHFNNQSAHGYSFPNLYNRKNTNTSVVTRGLLNKITYPTGGYTEFDWEAHQYSQVVAADRQSVQPENGYAGGSRIREIRSYAAVGGAPVKKTYYYVQGYNGSNLPTCASSGILNGKPQYLFTISNRPTSDPSSTSISMTYGLVHGLQSYSYNVMGSHIGYSEVIEMREDNSYMKYIFSNYNTDLHGVSHFDKTGGYLGWINTDVYRPTSNLDRERGKPLAEYTYNSSNNLLKRVIWAYTTDPLRFNKFAKRVELRERIKCADYSFLVELILAAAVKEFTYRYHPVSMEINEYESNGLNPITTLQTYSYTSQYDYLSEVATTSSNSIDRIEKYVYPFEITSGSDYVTMNKLTNKYVISPKIQTIKYINQSGKKIIDDEYHQYKEFYTGIIKPELIKKLETTTTITPGTNYSALMKEAISFDYNSNGRMIKSQPAGGTPTVFLWGYKGQYPIAKVENAAYTNVAYTSFEDNCQESNWTVPSTTRSTTSRTGNQSYNLSSGSISKSTFVANTPYTLSYWCNSTVAPTISVTNGSTPSSAAGITINGWTYFVHTFTPTSNSSVLTISGSGKIIDELRLHPSNAIMTTYTYQPLVGIASETDSSGRTIYYEYDNFGRLIREKDDAGKILREYQYNYAQ